MHKTKLTLVIASIRHKPDTKQSEYIFLRERLLRITNNGIAIRILFLLLFILTQCTSIKIPLYEYPPDWKETVKRDSTIDYYSKYLNGRKIYLDPGHGGEDRKNTNKNGDVIEADVNLNVALNLKKYLEKAGTQVFISRDKDTTVQLAYRSELANNSGAEIFISIHHNAPGKTEDDYTNYTSTYYHARETDYEYEPSDQDIARYIERDLAYVMGNPGGLGSFDGTLSDYNIYPGEGFSVLRKKTIPGVLVECAFHTSHFEELRLNNEEFNQIQAWGIFRGLAKYYRAGKPEIIFLADSTRVENNFLNISFYLNDTTAINPKLTQVFFNKEEKEFTFDKTTNVVSVKLEMLKPGTYPIRIIAANKNGNHSFPYHRQLSIGETAVQIEDGR
ncbi:MAG: N-acetylmuramoyl-L-alanine amidase [Ignavibacteriales bacterium]|nr:N-acetylmuramoyl-L-alanine amidase [Ignavibacteriales bacterium]